MDWKLSTILATSLLAVTACGSTDTQRAATGGLAGAGTGAVVGGPIGAVAGAAAGGTAGAVMDEGIVEKAEDYLGDEEQQRQAYEQGQQQSARQQQQAGAWPSNKAPSVAANVDQQTLTELQRDLKQMGHYEGDVDGIMGPLTRSAIARFQQEQGMRVTTRLDTNTVDRIQQAAANQPSGRQATGGTPSRQQQSAQDSSQQANQGQSGQGAAQQAGYMSEQQVKDELRQIGYVFITDFRREGDVYKAQAQRDAQSYNLTVNARQGHLVSAQHANPRDSAAIAGGQPMDKQQVRQDLQNEGFENITDLQLNNGKYQTQADMNGHSYDLEVNAQTGRLVSLNLAGSQQRGSRSQQ
ncbi:peptidoglycan-binding domain-containing protein [Desertibaculum subflavum]|uniref:peptidoglycan-binding domain-containing protein n=1 Tax=Desertibaculum subflavum TaxID=2268458 RepID=UPI0013C478D3